MTNTSVFVGRRITAAFVALCLMVAIVPLASAEPAAAAWTDVGWVNARLNCVTFVDSSLGFAAGASGTILKTTDGGLSWRRVHTQDGHEIRGIDFRDSSSGWAVTAAGVVFETTDGGKNWSVISNDLTDPFYVLPTIHDLGIVSPTQIQAVGGAQDTQPAVWSSSSGTGGWGIPFLAGSYDPPPERSPYPRDGLGVFYGLDVLSETRAWAVGHDYLKTPNKSVVWRYEGANWVEQSFGTETVAFFDVSFSNTNIGVAVGAGGRIRGTTNGGSTWSARTSGVLTDLKGVSLAPGTNSGWAVGSSNTILRTTDGGAAWTSQPSPVASAFEDVFAIDAATAVIVGSGGHLLRTTNGGATWESPAQWPAAPQMTSLSSASHPAGVWTNSTALSATWTATGTVTGYGWVLDTSNSTVPGSVNIAAPPLSTTVPGSGTYYLHVAAYDAGSDRWSNPWRYHPVLVDVTGPGVVDDVAAGGYTGSARITITASDAHSGVQRVEYRVNGGSIVYSAGGQAIVDFTTAGTRTLEYRAFDVAGNVSGGWIPRTVNVAAVPVPVAPSPVRVEGPNRFTTAIAAVNIVYPGVMPVGPDGNRTVVIASGRNWPDALSASGLAGAHRGSLLLTEPNSLPTAVADRIRSLGANRAIIIGGTAAVSGTVRSAVASVVGGESRVRRIWGPTRYATSNAIAAETVKVPGRTRWDSTAFVATGGDFPDALAAAPLAAAKGYPLYLAAPTGISDATINAMKTAGVTRVYLLGGISAVSPASESRIKTAGIVVVDRWAGTDRFATGRRIAERSLGNGLSVARVALATGRDFPDALAGGVMQGLTGSVLVLTESSHLHPEARAALVANAPGVEYVRFVGGLSVLSKAVRDSAMEAVSP